MPPEYKPYIGKEDDFQQSVATYISAQYPRVLFCHIPNGGSRNAIEAAKLRGIGVCKGFPDLMIFDVRQRKHGNALWCGLALELKVGKNSTTDSQKHVLNALSEQGWQCHVTYSLDEAMALIDDYLG